MDDVKRMDRRAGETVLGGRAAVAAASAGGAARLAVRDNLEPRQLASPVGGRGAGCDLRFVRRAPGWRSSWCALAAALALLLGAGAAQAQTSTTDTDPPELIAGTIHQKSVRLYFNEELDASGSAPAGTQFALTGTTTTAFGTISGVTISGTTIEMMTTNASTATETVTVAITTTTGIQDRAGNPLAAVSSFTLTNTADTDPGKPVLTTATVSGDTLTLTYDKMLHPDTPSTSALTVAGTATATTVTGVANDGRAVTLTLSVAVASGESGITVSYDNSNAPRIQNMWGSQADSLTSQAVTNNTPPAFRSATVNTETLTVTFNGSLDANSAPSGSAFTVSGGKTGTGTASISGATATVTLDAAVAHGARVTVSYARPAGNPLQDAAGNRVKTFAGQAVTNTTPPAFRSATVNTETLTVTFDGSLDANSAPSGSAFTVSGGKTGTGTASISGVTATVTLDAAVAHGATVTVSYTKPAGDPLQDAAGNEVKTFTGETVTNTTPFPTAPAPAPAPANGAPVADAGADQAVAVGAAVTLDGSGSSDPDGDPLTFAWTQTGGTPVTLDDDGAAQPTFTAPPAAAELAFALIVHDGAAASAADTVTVTVRAAVPAAPAQLTAVAMDAAVWLRWTMGSDGGSPVLRHEYRQSSDGGERWSDWLAIPDSAPGEANATGFTVDGLTNGAAHSFKVRAVNAAGAGPVSAPPARAMPRVNRAPAADAGPDRQVVDGAAVRLDGSGSSDPDGDPLTYAWTQTGGTAVTLDDAAAVQPVFTGPGLSGELLFALTVTDPEGAAGTDTTTVRVRTEAALRMQRTNEQVLPQVLRATAAGTLAAVVNRIERVAAGRTPGGDALRVAAPFAGRPGVYAVTDALPQVVDGAAFALSLPRALAGGDDDGPEAGRGALSTLTIWGSGDYRSLGDGPAGGAAGMRWDGALLNANLGVDLRPAPHVLTGLALSWTQGSFDYTDTTGGGGAIRGTWNSRLLGLHPYLSWTMPGLGMWVTGGVGWGDVVVDDTAAPAAERESRGALTQMQAGAGGRVTLLEADLLPGGRSSAALKAEASLVKGTLRGNAQFERMTVNPLTLRLLLEGRHEQELGGGARLTPSVEVGVRHDSGTGPIGTGLEVGGALRYGYGGWLTVEGRGRVLMAHSRAALHEWGAGGLLLVAPGGGGAEGLALQVRPEWGPVAAGAQRVWAGAAPAGGGERAEPAARLVAEASYGLPVLGAQGLLTPLAEVTLTDGAVRSYRLGGRFAFGDTLQVSLIGEQRTAVSALTLSGTLRH